MSAADKISAGLREALEFVKCEHRWERTGGGKHMKVKTCAKCGARLIQHK